MQKEFDKFKGVCRVIIVDLHNLKNKLVVSTLYDNNNLKNKCISTLHDKIDKINDCVSHITDCYNNRKSDFVTIVKSGCLDTYINSQKHSLENIKKVIENRILKTSEDIVISDNDDVPIKASGMGTYYSETIDGNPSLSFGNKQFLPDLIVGQHKSDRKLNNNGMSGACALKQIWFSDSLLDDNVQQMGRLKTKSKDTVIDVDKIGRGLTTPMITRPEFNWSEPTALGIGVNSKKHYYTKSKPMVPSEVVIENLPTNDGKANTKDIIL